MKKRWRKKDVTYTGAELKEAVATMRPCCEEPDPADYGVWVPGLPGIIESVWTLNCADWLKGLILDGIVAGVGAVLGFVPQMLVLFIFLAFLESCGYMARIAFVMDRIFRKFGLSGKSFIPILIGTGCGVPGIMASRTIENERDRRMTIMTTTFIPCGAKLPFIAMIAGCYLRRRTVGCSERIFPRHCSDYLLRYHSERRRRCLRAIRPVRYGAAGLPLADRQPMCSALWGARLVLH